VGAESEKLFDAWLSSKGLPTYKASKISVRTENGSYHTSFNLERSGGDFIASVPVVIKTTTGKEDFIVLSDNESKTVELITDTEPMSLVIDPYYDVPRTLAPHETPAVMSAYLGSSKKVAVIGDKAFDCFGKLSTQGNVEVVSPKNFKLENYKGYSVLFAGVSDSFYEPYFGKAPSIESAGLQVKAYANPFSQGKVVVTVQGEPEGLEGVCRRLEHYGKYSELVFVKGRNVKKEIDRTDNGVVYDIKNRNIGFRVKDSLKLTDIVEETGKARLFYIGERHDQYAHHANQLSLIKLLHEKHGKIAIGMEMFQRPFQQALDDYTNGLIDERTMLVRTEYFKRWRFDYHLYKPILSYARKHNIRIIALNAPVEATRKISQSGLNSLTKKEREHTSHQVERLQ
jgi:aminopeptidase N